MASRHRVGKTVGTNRRGVLRTVHSMTALLILGTLFTACGSSNSSVSNNANAVSVTTDSNGIPHVRASNFKALGYGEAWAFAQDNFCTLAQDCVTVNGDRSKYFGPAKLSLDYSAGVAATNLDSDMFWKSVIASGLIQREENLPPPVGPLPQIKSLYEGYVAGYNAYLRSGQLHDPRCAGKPWVRPITVNDMFLRGVQIVTEASSQQFISYEAAALAPRDPSPGAPSKGAPSTGSPSTANSTPQSTPATAAGSATSSAARSATGSTTGSTTANAINAPALDAALGRPSKSFLGSNGIGLGSQDTRSGNGMLLANPHFPWRGTERFWMVQLTVPGQYNVMGGTLEGFPLVGIGFNQDLAWTHTVSTDFRFTFYQLKLVPGDPTSYYVNSKPVKMGRTTVSVNTGHAILRHTFYTTRWGTVISLPQAGYNWTTSTAYTVDDSTISDTFRAANQYLRMGQSTSVAQLLAVESKYLATPTFNTIAADNTGHALYADVGNTPNVPLSLINSCMPSGPAKLVYAVSGAITLDGSRSACAWRNDPGTPVPGIFNATHLPHTIRTDYVENSNDSYWLANPSAPFPAFSPIVGNINTQQDYRTRLGNQLIAKRIAGTDGLGPPKFTLSTLQKMWEGDQSEEANLFLGSLVSACRATPSAKASNGTVVNLTAACNALAGYNKTGHLNASGGWLFSLWAAYAPTGSGLWADSFNAAHPLSTPSVLNTANPTVLQALANAVLNLEAHHVALNASYGQVQFAGRNGVKIPIPGCGTGCFNAIYAANGKGGPLNAAPYGEVIDGSSLVMTTELTPNGPISEGILTYSQATNPTSPWYSNMTTMYSKGEWVKMRYTRAQLAADHGAKTVTYVAP